MSPETSSFVIVFGPNAARASSAFRDQGVPSIVESPDIENLALEQAEGCNITLCFAHDVPAVWTGERQMNDWNEKLLSGTSISWTDMGSPEIRLSENAADDSALLLLHWGNGSTGTALRVGRAIGHSYAALAA
jgi:hypothetical protein